MTAQDDHGAGYTTDFEPVREAESEWLARRRSAADLPAPNGDLVGLAFSGGGIRSAVFNLGVLQALEASGLLRQVDYLSSVSGGGYIASCYTWLRARLPKNPVGSVFSASLASAGGSVLDGLRAHGKYLVSHRGFSIWTLIASILAATFANILVLGPPLVAVVYALTLGWLPVDWPPWLMLPGGHVPQGHHGYWLLLALGVLCLAALPVLATVFALVAGVPRFAPVHRIDALRVLMGRMLAFGPALIAIGLIPVAATLGDMMEHMFSIRHAHALGKHASYLMPVVTGIVSMLLDRRETGNSSGRLTTIGLSMVIYGLLILCYHIAVNTHIGSPVFLAFAALSVVLAFACDINRVSIHAYYRARLGEAFLPRLEGDDVPDPGNFDMRELTPDHGAPLHLINTTLNTTSSTLERLRSRQGASFFISPLYAGSSATGYRRMDTYTLAELALSNALTISGAAIDPDMVATRARSVSFLMALLNVRLGFWAHNPRCANRSPPPRPWWWIFITREMLGLGLDETRRHVHLSDGGGFENLGLYELIRRRVRYLIVTDAGADPQTTLGDLGRAVERVRVDFGAEIDLDADRFYHQRHDALAEQPFAIGSIRYADGSRGEILYLKPTLSAGLTADIYAYWRAHPAFPDEPTSEQFFAEPQFEAYRALGAQTIAALLGAAMPSTIAAWFERLRDARMDPAPMSTGS
ncbi:MAG: patatin-like phospholipase family protein [Dokdonella sp.]|uniref:patatin-like phospholipase family protein n=1 Tax=Dokdonella sp. TaxID=2291710 RepID=UPI0032645C7E